MNEMQCECGVWAEKLPCRSCLEERIEWLESKLEEVRVAVATGLPWLQHACKLAAKKGESE